MVLGPRGPGRVGRRRISLCGSVQFLGRVTRNPDEMPPRLCRGGILRFGVPRTGFGSASPDSPELRQGLIGIEG